MPFDIVRNDILNMQVDVIFNNLPNAQRSSKQKRLDLSALGRLLKMSDKSKRQSIKQAIKDDDKKRR